jgi:hypothetical protein
MVLINNGTLQNGAITRWYVSKRFVAQWYVTKRFVTNRYSVPNSTWFITAQYLRYSYKMVHITKQNTVTKVAVQYIIITVQYHTGLV